MTISDFAMIAAASIGAFWGQPAATEAGWSERGVFVFGSGIVLDFHQGVEIAPTGARPEQRTLLEDCSTGTHYCARGEIVRLTLPRTCTELSVGDHIETDGIRTVVYDVSSRPLSPHGPATARRYLLGDPEDPRVVYEYTQEAGVTRIALAWFPEQDLASLAREGRYDEFVWSEVNGGRGPQPRLFALRTLDPFGPCVAGERG